MNQTSEWHNRTLQAALTEQRGSQLVRHGLRRETLSHLQQSKNPEYIFLKCCIEKVKGCLDWLLARLIYSPA